MNLFDKIRRFFTRQTLPQPDVADTRVPGLPDAGSEAFTEMQMAVHRQKFMDDAYGTTRIVSPDTPVCLGNIMNGEPIDDNIPALIVVDDVRSGRKVMTRKGIWSYNLLDEMISYNDDGSISIPARSERTVTVSILTGRSHITLIIMPDWGINTGDVFMGFRISLVILNTGEQFQTYDKYFLFEKNPDDGRLEALALSMPEQVNDFFFKKELDFVRQLMSEGKYDMAQPILNASYQWIKSCMLKSQNPESFKSTIADIVNMLGCCYGARNLWDAALFYRVFGTNIDSDDTRAEGALDEAMIKARDIRALATYSADFLASNAALAVPQYPVTPLGFALELCLGIIPSDLSEMTCRFDSPSVAPLNIKGEDIPGFDFRSYAARMGSFTAVASRGKMGQGVVVLRVERDKKLIRLTIIAPDYITRATERSPLTMQVEYSATPYISRADFEKLRAQITEKVSDPDASLSAMEREISIGDADAAYDMFCARVAVDKEIWGDALYHFLKAYRRLAAKDIVGQAEEIVRAIIIDLNYQIGFVLEELSCHWMAISFLERNVPTNNIIYHTEFLNALANSIDLRAISVLNMFRRFLSEGVYKAPENTLRQFELFLDRRYAYILIETGKADLARSFLQSLIENPKSDANTREFAKNELIYLDKRVQSNTNTQNPK